MTRSSLLTFMMLLQFIGCARTAEPLQSKDKRLQVTLPDGWQAAVLSKTVGKIQAKCVEKTAYVTVISEAKEDFDHISLEEYVDTILKIEEQKGTVKGRSVSEQKKMKLNGADALQYEVLGTVNNVKIHYLKTFIESPTRWNQIMCWTTPSHWQESQDDFQKIVESFREIPSEQKK